MHIIHISDIHFSSPTVTYNSGEIKKALKKYILELAGNVIIVISGDITFQGNPRGFDEAKIFFGDLIDETNIDRKNIISCPGNHDITKGDTHPFSQFNAFLYSLRRDKSLDFTQNAYSSTVIDDVFFLVANSSYHQDHQYGLIHESIFDYLEVQKKDIETAKYRIAITHHHFFNQFHYDVSATRNAYPFLYALDQGKFDLVLHGHQHTHQKLPVGKNTIQIASARSFNYETKGYVNGVNHFEVSTGGIVQKILQFSKDTDPRLLKLVEV